MNRNNDKKMTSNKILKFSVYFYIFFSGIIIFVDAEKQGRYIEMIYGAASVMAVYALTRMLRKL